MTPTGFEPFAGISTMGVKPILRLEFSRNIWIECTFDHKFYVTDTEYKLAHEFNIGDTVLSSAGELLLTNKIDLNREEIVYDLIEVNGGHRYYTNKILSSNCEFLVYDETLVNSERLAELVGKEPISRMGQVRWYKKPDPSYTYLAALDPSLGTGGDFGAIQVFELPTMVQVAEWQHNITPIQGQIKIFRDVLLYIQDEIGIENNNNIYWSVENNTVGEAGLVVIQNLGEESFPGLFISEPIRKGHVRKFRKGFNTTYSNKISACARVKFLIEEDKMQISSRPLLSELKTFVAQGITFKAKTGQHDDLVSALLLVVRMSVILAEWDPRIFDSISVRDSIDTDWEPPMPIFVSTNM